MVDGVPHPQGHLPEFSINLNFEFCRTQHSFVFDSGTNLVFQVNILLSTKLISVLSRLVKIYQINSLLAQFVIILKKYNFDEKITHYFSLCFQLLECAICNDKVLNSFFWEMYELEIWNIKWLKYETETPSVAQFCPDPAPLQLSKVRLFIHVKGKEHSRAKCPQIMTCEIVKCLTNGKNQQSASQQSHLSIRLIFSDLLCRNWEMNLSFLVKGCSDWPCPQNCLSMGVNFRDMLKEWIISDFEG